MGRTGEGDAVSDAPSWVAVGVSLAALGWTAWVDYRTRQETRRAAARQDQAVIDGAISRVVANWAATRLKDFTVSGDPTLEVLEGLKQSTHRWRLSCAEPLAVASETSLVYKLINQTVKAVSEFDGVIDPMRNRTIVIDGNAVQNALTRMQDTVQDSIHQLSAYKGHISRGAA
jgi:hypothetical protein